MSIIDIAVFLPCCYTINTEEKNELLRIQVGYGTILLDPSFRPTLNTSIYRLLLSVSLQNTNIQRIHSIIKEIAVVLNHYPIWIQLQEINYSSRKEVICEGYTSILVINLGEEVYSMEGYYINGTDLFSMDDMRKENADLDKKCLSRDTDYVEVINVENQVFFRLFNEEGKTVFIMNGNIIKDERNEKTNYYLLTLKRRIESTS